MSKHRPRVPGTDVKITERWRQLRRYLRMTRPVRNATGLKRWYVPGGEDEQALTLYARKELRRRRRARKTSHESRRFNHQRD